MANKQVRLILHGADREAWQSGDFTLQVRRFDSNGIKKMQFQSGERNTAKLKSDKSDLQLDLELFFNAGQRYFLLIKAPGHREIFQVLNRRSFITREDGAEVERPDTTIRTIMIPKKAKSLDLDAGFNKLKSRESPLVKEDIGISRETYNNLKPAAKMAMLNIEAKLRSTEVDGATLSKLVTGLRHVEPDRIYVMMQPQIKEMVERSPVFAPAPGPRREEQTQSVGTPRQLETSSVSGGEPATFLLRKSRELAGPLFRQRTVVFGRC